MSRGVVSDAYGDIFTCYYWEERTSKQERAGAHLNAPIKFEIATPRPSKQGEI